jgi:hypothetical protein
MSAIDVELARVHAARALDTIARADRGEPITSSPGSIGPEFEIGALRAHVRILAQDIATLTQLAMQAEPA